MSQARHDIRNAGRMDVRSVGVGSGTECRSEAVHDTVHMSYNSLLSMGWPTKCGHGEGESETDAGGEGRGRRDASQRDGGELKGETARDTMSDDGSRKCRNN